MDYKKQKKLLQGSFVYIWMYKSEGKTLAILDKYPLKVVKLKDCKMKQGGSKTCQKRH